jgi:hypothetical protein
MKKFGQKFKEYKPLEIEHVSIPDTKSINETKFLNQYNLDKYQLQEIMPKTEPYAYRTSKGELSPLRVLRNIDIPNKLKEELNKSVIEIAPTANIYQISPSQKDLSDFIKNTLTQFNYYVVELGLNVMLGKRFTIPELLFEVDLKCNGKDATDVTAFDIAPDDSIKHIKVISGKISLGITKLLKFAPAQVGQIISDLLDIQINPIEFEWGFDKYLIDAAGKKNYRIYWKIYKTSISQGFNPTIILKARKDVNTISANVRATYGLKSGLTNFQPAIRTNEMSIKILSM